MITSLRLLAASIVALLLAIHAVGGEGGENAGGTGVWILPRPTSMTSSTSTLLGCGAPRSAPIQISSLDSDLKFELGAECGISVATLFAGPTSEPIPLDVVGRQVVVPASLVQSLVASQTLVVEIVVADAAMKGYVLRLQLDPAAGSAQLLVF